MEGVARLSARERSELLSETATQKDTTPAIDDPYVIDINYSAAFPDDYLRPQVRLEIGPLASWLPYEERRISCYAAEAFPKVFEQRECAVKVIKAERTFWEKATILHHEAYRPEGNPQPPRYSRHYYDLAKMAQSPVKARALADPEILASVVAFKQRFYPWGWARYDVAKPGSLVLVPGGHVLTSAKSDYRAMENMIFGEAPDFEEILAVLQALQEEINAPSGIKIAILFQGIFDNGIFHGINPMRRK